MLLYQILKSDTGFLSCLCFKNPYPVIDQITINIKAMKSLFLFLILIYGLTLSAQHNSQDGSHMAMGNTKNIFVMIMDTMMVNMDNAPKGINVDSEFLLQMIPHHQGAIAMAKYEIAQGKDFTMVQLAKSILHEQTFEVQLMRLWLQTLNIKEILPEDYNPEINNSMQVMMNNMPPNTLLTNTDKSFALIMRPHHQAGIDMARVILKYSDNTATVAFAKNIISAEQIEIDQMTQFLNEKK